MSARDDLLARADNQLTLIGRRGGTGVPGTISVIRDLAAALRAAETENARLRAGDGTAPDLTPLFDALHAYDCTRPETLGRDRTAGNLVAAVRALRDGAAR